MQPHHASSAREPRASRRDEWGVGATGMKRTTLQSKLKHLGIDPRSGKPGQ
jgi:hypothetical protein